MIVMQGKVVDNIVIMDSHATDYAILHRRWIVQEVGYVEMIALAKKDGREMKFADVMAVGRSLIATSEATQGYPKGSSHVSPVRKLAYALIACVPIPMGAGVVLTWVDPTRDGSTKQHPNG
ncbi:hypothetical protein V8B97DRAFT_1918576 [Scleroderma yunnanense]